MLDDREQILVLSLYQTRQFSDCWKTKILILLSLSVIEDGER